MKSETPIRVCYLIDELAQAGTETQLLALIRNLDRSRVQPSLCLLRGDNPVSQALEPDHCPVYRLKVGSLKHPATLWKAWKLSQFLRRNHIDILQIYFPDSTYLGTVTGWLSGVKSIIRTRNNVGHWLTPTHRMLGRMLNPLTTLTITNCDAAREALLKDEKPRADSVVVLENGVDLERFDNVMPLRKDKPLSRLGVIANLRPVKGLDVLIEAVRRLVSKYPALTLQVAGEGNERANLQSQIDEAGLTTRVQLRGAVADIPAFLNETDIGISASRAEGMSNALLEQMAAGRAIIATNVGGNPKLIDHERHGLLIPPDDPNAMTEAMERLLNSSTEAIRFAQSARQKVEQEYSRQAMVQRFEELYCQLRNRKK